MKLAICSFALAATAALGEVEVNVQGQSGSFKVSDTDDAFEELTVRLRGVEEIDSEGEAVGAAGAVKHSVNSFASSEFDVTIDNSYNYSNITASRITYDITIDNGVGNIIIDTCVLPLEGLDVVRNTAAFLANAPSGRFGVSPMIVLCVFAFSSPPNIHCQFHFPGCRHHRPP